MRQVVKNQQELDKILKEANGNWIEIEIQFENAVLWGNSHAELRENSHAELWENSHAVLRDFSVAHKFGNNKIKQGLYASIIDVKYPDNIRDWCAIKGIKIKKDRIYLWKTINKDGKDFYSNSILYTTKKDIVDPKWRDDFDGECGAGLHLADCPSSARLFCQGREGARLLKVSVNINDCRVYGGQPSYPMKLRAKKCRMVREFPIDYEGE